MQSYNANTQATCDTITQNQNIKGTTSLRLKVYFLNEQNCKNIAASNLHNSLHSSNGGSEMCYFYGYLK